jgi:hypothetical protein
MLETFAALLLAHVLADYVLQTRWIVVSKRGPGFAVHIGLVFVTALLCLGQVSLPVLAVTAAHLAIDATKTLLMPSRLWSYLADQALHLMSIAMVAALFPEAWAIGVWADMAPAWIPAAIAGLAGLIFATRAGQFAIDYLVGGKAGEASSGQGAQTGLVERALVFISVTVGQPWWAGALLAAKAAWIGLSGARRPAALGRIATGTLASFGWAFATGLATAALVTRLVAASLSGP